MAVQKKGVSVRICADLSTRLNKSLDVHRYPFPLNELFGSLNGAQKFSKLDLSEAHLQIPLDKEIRKLVNINAHKGLFLYNRMPFGAASAPGIFQQMIKMIFQGCSGAVCYLDDIKIYREK